MSNIVNHEISKLQTVETDFPHTRFPKCRDCLSTCCVAEGMDEFLLTIFSQNYVNIDQISCILTVFKRI